MELADRHWVEVVQLRAADPVRRDEAGVLEDAEVLHHAEARDLEGAFDLAETLAVALEEAIENRAARRVRECPEDGLVARISEM